MKELNKEFVVPQVITAEDAVEQIQERRVIFISGNTDLDEKQFMTYYAYQISELLKNKNIFFNLSDDDGCSAMLQSMFAKMIDDKSRVNVFHMGNSLKNLFSGEFVTVGYFNTLEERNAAMTLSSNMDYHIILEGKGKSAVEKNICRRNTPEYNYMKHWVVGNRRFWDMFKGEEKQPNA